MIARTTAKSGEERRRRQRPRQPTLPSQSRLFFHSFLHWFFFCILILPGLFVYYLIERRTGAMSLVGRSCFSFVYLYVTFFHTGSSGYIMGDVVFNYFPPWFSPSNSPFPWLLTVLLLFPHAHAHLHTHIRTGFTVVFTFFYPSTFFARLFYVSHLFCGFWFPSFFESQLHYLHALAVAPGCILFSLSFASGLLREFELFEYE